MVQKIRTSWKKLIYYSNFIQKIKLLLDSFITQTDIWYTINESPKLSILENFNIVKMFDIEDCWCHTNQLINSRHLQKPLNCLSV